MAKCLTCGSQVVYDIGLGKLKCISCDNTYEPAEIDKEENAEEQEMMGVTVFTCPNCGGELYSTDRDLTGCCSYCGSNVTFMSRMAKDKRPKMILPFSLTKEACKELYLKEVKEDYFAPKALKDPEFIDGFRGIYMPYYISRARQEGDLKLYGVISREQGDFRIIDTRRFECSLEASYEDLYHDASSSFSDDISERIEPFHLTKDTESCLKPFYPSYLSGFYAEPADVEAEAYTELYRKLTESWTDEYIKNHRDFQGYTMCQPKEKGFFDSFKGLNEAKANKDLFLLQKEETPDDKDDDAAKKQKKKRAKKAQKEREQEVEEFKKKKQRADEESAEAMKDEKEYSYETYMEESRLAMLPVWFLSYRNKDRVAYMTINGQTGRVSREFPMDMRQFLKAAAVFTVILFLAAVWLMLLPDTMLSFVAWFGAAILFMNYSELNMVREHSLDVNIHTERKDSTLSGATAAIGILCALFIVSLAVGLLCEWDGDMEFLRGHFMKLLCALAALAVSVYNVVRCRGVRTKLKKSEKRFPAFYLAGLSALLSFAVLYKNPANDLIYYGVAVFALFAQSISILIMAGQFSEISARPLPQFAHKGGDDRA